jgi:hypothetical protein
MVCQAIMKGRINPEKLAKQRFQNTKLHQQQTDRPEGFILHFMTFAF